MSDIRIPCGVPSCRSNAEWLAWELDANVNAFCYRCLLDYKRARSVWPAPLVAMPILFGLN